MKRELRKRLHYGGLGLVAVLVVLAGYLGGIWPAIPRPLSTRGGVVGVAVPPAASVPATEWTAAWSLEQHPSGYPLLPGAEHFEILPAAVEHGAYHHHPQIAHFRDGGRPRDGLPDSACWNHSFAQIPLLKFFAQGHMESMCFEAGEFGQRNSGEGSWEKVIGVQMQQTLTA